MTFCHYFTCIFTGVKMPNTSYVIISDIDKCRSSIPFC